MSVLEETAARRSGPFWRCRCGHPLYEHGRRTVPNAGYQQYVHCGIVGCLCELYEAADGSKWPNGAPRARNPEPAL